MSEDAILVEIKNLNANFENFKFDNKEDHSRIEAQTTKTNGRVNGLETREVENAKWKAKLEGQVSVIKWLAVALLMSVVAPLLVKWFAKILNIS